eukprot:2541765-Pyramimonas_sp.AAC.1
MENQNVALDESPALTRQLRFDRLVARTCQTHFTRNEHPQGEPRAAAARDVRSGRRENGHGSFGTAVRAKQGWGPMTSSSDHPIWEVQDVVFKALRYACSVYSGDAERKQKPAGVQVTLAMVDVVLNGVASKVGLPAPYIECASVHQSVSVYIRVCQRTSECVS